MFVEASDGALGFGCELEISVFCKPEDKNFTSGDCSFLFLVEGVLSESFTVDSRELFSNSSIYETF